MSRTPPRFLNFRRTFALLILLVVLPSAGLSGFGVVAIINERAAVEKRLEAAWRGTLESLSEELPRILASASLEELDGQLQFVLPDGARVSEPGGAFQMADGQIRTQDTQLYEALTAVLPEAGGLPTEPTAFSLTSGGRAVLVAAERRGGVVYGVRLSVQALEAQLAERVDPRAVSSEPVRFAMLPVPRDVSEGGLLRVGLRHFQRRERRFGGTAFQLLLHLAGAGADALLHILGGAFDRVLHLAKLVELHRAIDFGLDVVHIALRLAQQGADSARHARQLFRADDDQRHGADQCQLGNAEFEHVRCVLEIRTSDVLRRRWSACRRPGPS